MGKDKDKSKDKSRKTKDGDKNKTGKDHKKPGKEKGKTVDKKSDKTKPKNGKPVKPKTAVHAKTPKSKDKEKSNKEKAKPTPKSKDGKSSGKKSAHPKSIGKTKTAPKSAAAKANPKSTKAIKKPKSEVPKPKKNKVEKSRVEDLESTISSSGSGNNSIDEDEDQVVVAVKDVKKGKITGAKKKEHTATKPKSKMAKTPEPSLTGSDEEAADKVVAKPVKKKPSPKKIKKELPETKGPAKKTDKDQVKSCAAPKKSPPSKNKDKEKKASVAPPIHQPTKKVVKPAKTRSESQESAEKEESDTGEEENKYDPDQTTSVDHNTGEEDDKAEESAGEQQDDAGNDDETATDDQGEPEAEYATYEETPGEPMEFTKPTVNQPKGRKETSPMCYSTVIGTNEFEALFDEITELNSGAATLKHSYGSIVTSLVHMHNKRMKNKMPKDQKKLPHQQQINFMTTRSEVSAKTAAQMEDCLEVVEKYDLERFINPVTRDKTFKMLFAEIDDLNKKTHKMRTEFFDAAANFLREKYDHQTAYKLDRKRFNQYKLWTKKLSTVVDDISRAYNDDLLLFFNTTSR